MTGIPESLRSRLIDIFADTPEVRRAILFGSRSRGDAEERSDIDLAVEAPGVSDRRRLELLDELEDSDTLLKIDLAWWEQASSELRKRITSEGEVLYERR
jgi:predicted nucleotidyltransferase